MDFFSNRRTVRNYTDRPVSEQLLQQMLTRAMHAPNTGNMQLYSVIATRSPEKKAQLAPAHFNQPCVEGCSVVLTFCLDFNRFEQWCRLSDATPGYDNFQSFIYAMIDTCLFAQQFCTIAEMEGLGCCYLGTTTYNAPTISEVLGLPDRVVPVTTITVGYPDGDAPVSSRLPLRAVYHSETYTPFTDADIEAIYSAMDADPANRRFIDENGKQTLAQVFTDVRYTREANEYFSKVYLDFIRSKGF